jgi:hypothetical protein
MSENVIQYGGLVSVKWQNISIISVLSFSWNPVQRDLNT